MVHDTATLDSGVSDDDHGHVGPVRRSLERIRRNGDHDSDGTSFEERESLRLEAMLLRESSLG
jgi:hypothetical protein